MKKGFTIVELIVSFSLTMIVAVFLFQIIIILRNLYNNNAVKTELLNKQFVISDKLNTAIKSKGIYTINKCGSHCLNFIYTDGTGEQLLIDYNDNSFTFGEYKTKLPENSYFKNVSVNVVYSPVFDESKNNAILYIDIPIYNDNLKSQNLGVNVVYQFNSNNANISDISFDSN